MNTDTGDIYHGEAQIARAIAEGLPIVPVSERVARLMMLGQGEERRRQRRADRKAKRKMGRESRRRNRR